ncbi:unnamed protein product [Amoebophrya sp. A120]|nr:unnamed protein product [Amoebophrya sp. A120]|eukprot:GSA120T00010382001.1
MPSLESKQAPVVAAGSANSSSRYEKVKLVGEGSFGKCWLVRDRHSEKQLIQKVIDLSKMSEEEKNDTYREVQVLGRLRHPYIIRYRDSFLTGSSTSADKAGTTTNPDNERGNYNDHRPASPQKLLCLVMDYATNGDLYTRIRKQKKLKQFLPASLILRWFTQIALAVKYIHDQKILHRDLKTQNIFLTKVAMSSLMSENNPPVVLPNFENVKIGDFGIARVLSHTSDVAKTAIGTPFYMSPEICQAQPYDYKSDIWAIGCCLYEMITLKHAFDDESMKGLVLKILKGEYEKLKPGNSSSSSSSAGATGRNNIPAVQHESSHQLDVAKLDELKQVVDLCLQLDPRKRPKARDLLNKQILRKQIFALLEEDKKRAQALDAEKNSMKKAQGLQAGVVVPAEERVPEQQDEILNPKKQMKRHGDGQIAEDHRREQLDRVAAAVAAAAAPAPAASLVVLDKENVSDPRTAPNAMNAVEQGRVEKKPTVAGQQRKIQHDHKPQPPSNNVKSNHYPAGRSTPRKVLHRPQQRPASSKRIEHYPNDRAGVVKRVVVRSSKSTPVKKTSEEIFDHRKGPPEKTDLPGTDAKQEQNNAADERKPNQKEQRNQMLNRDHGRRNLLLARDYNVALEQVQDPPRRREPGRYADLQMRKKSSEKENEVRAKMAMYRKQAQYPASPASKKIVEKKKHQQILPTAQQQRSPGLQIRDENGAPDSDKKALNSQRERVVVDSSSSSKTTSKSVPPPQSRKDDQGVAISSRIDAIALRLREEDKKAAREVEGFENNKRKELPKRSPLEVVMQPGRAVDAEKDARKRELHASKESHVLNRNHVSDRVFQDAFAQNVYNDKDHTTTSPLDKARNEYLQRKQELHAFKEQVDARKAVGEKARPTASNVENKTSSKSDVNKNFYEDDAETLKPAKKYSVFDLRDQYVAGAGGRETERNALHGCVEKKQELASSRGEAHRPPTRADESAARVSRLLAKVDELSKQYGASPEKISKTKARVNVLADMKTSQEVDKENKNLWARDGKSKTTEEAERVLDFDVKSAKMKLLMRRETETGKEGQAERSSEKLSETASAIFAEVRSSAGTEIVERDNNSNQKIAPTPAVQVSCTSKTSRKDANNLATSDAAASGQVGLKAKKNYRSFLYQHHSPNSTKSFAKSELKALASGVSTEATRERRVAADHKGKAEFVRPESSPGKVSSHQKSNAEKQDKLLGEGSHIKQPLVSAQIHPNVKSNSLFIEEHDAADMKSPTKLMNEKQQPVVHNFFDAQENNNTEYFTALEVNLNNHTGAERFYAQTVNLLNSFENEMLAEKKPLALVKSPGDVSSLLWSSKGLFGGLSSDEIKNRMKNIQAATAGSKRETDGAAGAAGGRKQEHTAPIVVNTVEPSSSSCDFQAEQEPGGETDHFLNLKFKSLTDANRTLHVLKHLKSVDTVAYRLECVKAYLENQVGVVKLKQVFATLAEKRDGEFTFNFVNTVQEYLPLIRQLYDCEQKYYSNDARTVSTAAAAAY